MSAPVGSPAASMRAPPTLPPLTLTLALALLTLPPPAAARALENVTVVRYQLALEELHSIVVDYNTEYILDFIPTEEQSRWPTRVWMRSDGGDLARPLLITHRQREGAGLWQLPHWSGDRLVREFERTLCPRDSGDDQDSECVEGAAAAPAPGWFSLHAVSACARPLALQLRAAPARDWRLQPGRALVTRVDPATPRVHHYMFAEDERHVRLVVASDDDVCATISIQNYTCPIAETLEEIEVSSLRMTVQRSGAVQLSRERYPRGFYVVAVVHATDEACLGAAPADEDWLWEAALYGAERADARAGRNKTLTLDTRPALTPAQYGAAAGATLGACALFYAAFGLLVLAQRWPRFGRLVLPRAVLARPKAPADAPAENGVQSQTDTGRLAEDSPRRRRRDSDATFDSSDMSDSESSDEERAAGVAPVAPASPAAPASPRAGENGARPGVRFAAPGDAAASEVDRGGEDDIRVAEPPPAEADVRQAGAGAAEAAGAAAGPYGLPARLRVAALARRRARVHRARSDRYLTTLATVALFYALPVVQFVVAFQIVMNVSGSLDLCYYNFLCAHPAGELADFNHVFSNIGYLLLGALFMLQLQRRRRNRDLAPRDEEYGIPAHYGLLASLGAGMMVVALLSASYHVCPNRLNFQFDVSFMYVLAVLSMVKIYQARHADVNARAHATFGVLAVLIAIVVWGVLGGGALFWAAFTVLHVFAVLLLSLRVYYIGQFRLEKATFQRAAESLRALPRVGLRPLYTARLVLLLVANAVNWAFALYGLATQSADFASHLLFVLLGNALVYMVFYLSMKLLHGERPRWYAWCYLAAAAAAWAPALYFFTAGSSSWSSTPAQSRHREQTNKTVNM